MTAPQAPLQTSPGVAPIFAALGDPCRLSIISRLCNSGPLPTIKLQEKSGVTRQGLTKHLQILANAGLVESFRVGRDRHWQLQPQQLTELRLFLAQVTAEWDDRLNRLKALVEDGAPSRL